jgi:hypothetical protein
LLWLRYCKHFHFYLKLLWVIFLCLADSLIWFILPWIEGSYLFNLSLLSKSTIREPNLPSFGPGIVCLSHLAKDYEKRTFLVKMLKMGPKVTNFLRNWHCRVRSANGWIHSFHFKFYKCFFNKKLIKKYSLIQLNRLMHWMRTANMTMSQFVIQINHVKRTVMQSKNLKWFIPYLMARLFMSAIQHFLKLFCLKYNVLDILMFKVYFWKY